MFGLFIIEAGSEPVQFCNVYDGKPLVYDTGAEAAEACRLAADSSLGAAGWRAVKLQPRRLASDAWKARELSRFADGTYTALPWADLPALTLTADHYAHISTEDGAKIAYTQDAEKGAGDIQTRVKPGRYLAQFYGAVLDAPTIARMAVEFDKQFGEHLVLSFAATADDIERVYTDGPSSCMSGEASRYQSDVHPVRIYAAGDLQVAYLVRNDGITARALVWPANKVHSRIYGDETRLGDLLNEAGYTCGELDGAKLTRIETRGGFVMPYIDYGTRCTDHETHLTIGGRGRIWCGNTNGLSGPGMTCEGCDTDIDEADCRSNDNGNTYCDDCYSELYSTCERSGAECSAEEMRVVICNNRYGSYGRTTQHWGARAIADHAFQCEGNDSYYSTDFCVELADGTVWSQDYFDDHGAVCDGSGDSISCDDAVTLADGTVWSQDYFDDHGVAVDGENYAKGDEPKPDGDEADAADADAVATARAKRVRFSPTRWLPGQLELELPVALRVAGPDPDGDYCVMLGQTRQSPYCGTRAGAQEYLEEMGSRQAARDTSAALINEVE